ncbi:hypothetical protein O181_114610 [Austropuccinia psidii MF-1]|uniref:Large ribosomal subunit protein uL10 n=1 Tax=Austropuccinia psidii MF-1 TaxID=1389203 RepID=A0A9Q3PVN4_9BASI|nr:hypothetical protein [Austropuccinia psidii MF-1]
MGKSREFKESYFNKLRDLMAKFPLSFIINVDNVGSNQMHQIRQSLPGKGIVLMGKNTMVRRAIRNIMGDNPQYERLLPLAGAFAPLDVYVPAGNTGMDPGKTSFFQALGIHTKIARGTIEIVSDIKIVMAGSHVGASEATLLNLLKISPFTYGMTVVSRYDNGNIFTPTVLDVDEQTLIDHFLSGIETIAAISLAANYPTIASVPHSLVNSYKNIIAIALTKDYIFEGAQKPKDHLDNPPRTSVTNPTPTIMTIKIRQPSADLVKAWCCLRLRLSMWVHMRRGGLRL